LLVLTPWTLYNYERTGKFSPVNSTLPAVFSKSFDSLAYSAEYSGNRTFEPVLDGPATTRDVIVSKITNVYKFWNPGAGGYQAEQLVAEFPPATYFIFLYKVGYFVMLALAFSTLFLLLRDVRVLGLWFIITYVWALHATLFPYPRYTLPIIPVMILLAAFATFNRTQIYHQAQQVKLFLKKRWSQIKPE